MIGRLALILTMSIAGCAAASERAATSETLSRVRLGTLTLETVMLRSGDLATTLCLASRQAAVERRPVILMLGSLSEREMPSWSANLLDEGYMLAAFAVARPPDPDPARRPQWLVFDERFAHGYVQGGHLAPQDAARVIDYLLARGDVHPRKIGWLGSSSTGIPGLAVACREPRLAAIVVFVSTGAYRLWLESWHANGLWRGGKDGLWPETQKLLSDDPILHVKGLFPKAVLMVSGGEDKIVDPKTAQAFYDAAKPFYRDDPERLRLAIYHGMGHNLPGDVVQMYAEHWFRLYMHPVREAPPAPSRPASLGESASRTQINASEHKDVVGAR